MPKNSEKIGYQGMDGDNRMTDAHWVIIEMIRAQGVGTIPTVPLESTFYPRTETQDRKVENSQEELVVSHS